MVLRELITRPSVEVIVGILAVLAGIEWLIMMAGRRFINCAEVTDRSLHTKPTPTCGGLIWVLSGICAAIAFCNTELASTWIFVGGIAVLALVSFVDDIHPLPPVPRLIVQIAVMALSFKQLIYPQALDIFLLILFLGVGIINTINFLDGICGMLAFYGIVVTGSLLYVVTGLNNPALNWTIGVLVALIMAQVVFACFNVRDVIFAGDVGSITLGYIQVYITILLILTTRDASLMIFFAVCIFDTGLTTLQRLFSGESILKPHRMCIYQKLVSDKKIPHLVVSIIYTLLQLLINALFFLIPTSQHWTYFLAVCALLTIAYFMVRFSFRK